MTHLLVHLCFDNTAHVCISAHNIHVTIYIRYYTTQSNRLRPSSQNIPTNIAIILKYKITAFILYINMIHVYIFI